MQSEVPSLTAQRVAMRRAAHQILDRPPVLDDPLALRIVGAETRAAIEARPQDFEGTRIARYLRAFLAARSRFAEDELAAAVQHGVRQFVILGAGLDTFAYRNPHTDLTVFEVDHPATQNWKRERLAEAGIATPSNLRFVLADFERDALAPTLARAGFDAGAPAFFSWLGVSMYLARETVDAVLRQVGSLPSASGIVFDYALSPTLFDARQRAVFDALAERVREAGEPWQTFFEPQALERALRTLGFHAIEDLGPGAMNDRYFAGRTDDLRVGSLAHVVCARV